MEPRVEIAEPLDLPAVLSLLNACGLPEAGLACSPGTLILVARTDGELVGCAALELYGQHAFLRSVAVAAAQRGRGLGDRLTEAALDLACRLRVVEVHLLTEGAEGFFARHGFEPVDRSQVPVAVTGSVEFTSCCCSSATSMVKHMEVHRARRRLIVPALSLHDLAPASHHDLKSCACG
ncbi:MAG: GNAT family N-acetyltransferase [Gemmatimonadota bacterium]|nr:MAG: GNAT family N-acetyltransferase [Gemmatimonadota bacterium]